MSEPWNIAMYAIERRLGSTGPTEAFRACFIGTKEPRPVVLKRLQPRLATRENVAAFLEGARAASWLDHPNIAELYESDVDEAGVPFTVMEFIDGPTVAQILLRATETGELPLSRLVAMFVGAAEALDHAHHARSADGQALNLVHGDVSTDNLRVGLDGVTKVLDFGQARFGQATKSKVRHTAPELLRDPSLKPGPASDVFGLGVSLYLATTGAWPFAGINDEQLKASALSGRHRRPSELIPGFPEKLEQAICGALEMDPERRLSARAVADQLSAWLATTGEQMSDQELGEWIRSSFADRHHGTPIEQAVVEPTPAAIIAVKSGPSEVLPFDLPPPPPPPSVPPPPGVAGPTPLPFKLPLPDPFGPTSSGEFTAVDVSISGLTRLSPEAAAAIANAAELVGLNDRTAVRAVGAADLEASRTVEERTAVRAVGAADLDASRALEEQTAVRAVDATGLDESSALSEQTAVRAVDGADLDASRALEGQTTVRAADGADLAASRAVDGPQAVPIEDAPDETGELPASALPSPPPPPRPPVLRRALAIAATLGLLLALGAGAVWWRERRSRPAPPSEARLYIDTAQRAVLANNPTLTREMLDKARALPVLTPTEFIELATLDDAAHFARLLGEAEAALTAGDTRLALVKLEQVDKALPNSPEAQALRLRVERGSTEVPAAPVEEPAAEALLAEPELLADAGTAASDEPEALTALPAVPEKTRLDRKASARSTLSVKTTPAGAEVFVDGTRVGRAPLARLGLPRGPHALALTLPGFERHEQAVTSDGRPVVLEVALVAVPAAPAPRPQPKLEVTSPVQAKVSVDGKLLGQTPLSGLTLEPGRHVLVATAEGYETVTRQLELTDGAQETVALSLVKVEVAPEPVATPAPTRREPSPDGPITKCPEDCELQGNEPPAGNALWCATATGVKQGRYIRWNANGKKAEEGEYVNGRKNGVWIEYFENGTERERTSWRRGVRAW